MDSTFWAKKYGTCAKKKYHELKKTFPIVYVVTERLDTYWWSDIIDHIKQIEVEIEDTYFTLKLPTKYDLTVAIQTDVYDMMPRQRLNCYTQVPKVFDTPDHLIEVPNAFYDELKKIMGADLVNIRCMIPNVLKYPNREPSVYIFVKDSAAQDKWLATRYINISYKVIEFKAFRNNNRKTKYQNPTVSEIDSNTMSPHFWREDNFVIFPEWTTSQIMGQFYRSRAEEMERAQLTDATMESAYASRQVPVFDISTPKARSEQDSADNISSASSVIIEEISEEKSETKNETPSTDLIDLNDIDITPQQTDILSHPSASLDIESGTSEKLGDSVDLLGICTETARDEIDFADFLANPRVSEKRRRPPIPPPKLILDPIVSPISSKVSANIPKGQEKTPMADMVAKQAEMIYPEQLNMSVEALKV